MRALALEHLKADPVGIFGDVLTEREIAVDRVMLLDGDPLPDWRDYDLIVAMGAGVSVWEEDEYPWIADEKRTVREAVLAGLPYFGVCFGVQLLADVFGGRSFRGPEPEIGVNQMFLTAAARQDPVFRGFPADLEVCEWHSNHFTLPRGAIRLARSPRYDNQAIRYGRVAYGIQCHLEPSLDDIRAWLDEFPDSAGTLEQRHGAGSVERLLDDYAAFVPFIQETARQVFGRWLENALAYGGLGGAVRAAAGLAPRSRGTAELFGREADVARIDAALAAARQGGSALLVLRGDAGIGKTTLLDATASRARGLRVLRCAGEESAEAERPFAGLATLVHDLSDRLEHLSSSRADAAGAILGLGSGAAITDRFAVYAGVLDLLVSVALNQPLLLLVDDAHMLDDASAEALAFIAGRLGSDGIALIVATESDVDLSGAEDLRLSGLAPPDARALLGERSPVELDASVADRIVEVAGGNPLALLEIPLDLTVEQRSGAADVEGSLAPTAEWSFLRRISALPAPARQALVVAALAGSQEARAIPRAWRTLGIDSDALAAARDSGLVRADGHRLVFRHPLARATVTYSALRADRLAAHAALAAALDGDSRTWHMARAATHPDESIASDLTELAERARDVGAFAAAARGLERAARLTSDPDRRGSRLLEAARAAHLAGNVNAALDHVDAALRTDTGDPGRRHAEHLRGRIMARAGAASAARDQLVAVAARCERDEPLLAAEMLADAVAPALRAGRPSEAVEIARRAVELAGRNGGHAKLATQTALGIALIFAGDYAQGAALIDAAAALEDRAEIQPRLYLGFGLLLAGRHEAARRVLTAGLDDARARGIVNVLPYGLIRLADVELELGRWAAAGAMLGEAERLAEETGQVGDLGLSLGTNAWLEAARGHDEDCRAHVDEALELAGRLGRSSSLDRATAALGLLELGRGNPELAIGHLEEACRLKDELGFSDAATAPHCLPDLIEAYALAGRDSEARERLARFEREARRTERPSALAAAARCRALLSPDGELDLHFAEALDLDDSPGPYELARTQLLYGTRLLEAGRPKDGARVLSDALRTFELLGADPWADRARTAIRTTTEPLPPPRVSLSDRLSPLELEVALAAADGGSPAQIAERLFMGPRTVELQLASAMIKLGVDSRAQLAETLDATRT